jgi:nitrogen fixation NifU-like protein
VSDLYDPLILDHAKQPRNRGPLPDADRSARADNPLCGDRVTVALALDGDRVRAIRFEGRGCAVALASASVLTTLVEGATRDEIARLRAALDRAVDPGGGEVDGPLAAFAGVRAAPSRRRCATLAWEALEAALK